MSEEQKPKASPDFIPFTPRMRAAKAELDAAWTSMVNGFLAAYDVDGKWEMAQDGSGMTRTDK